MKGNRSWWHELFSGDNSQVSTMAVISVVLSAPIVCLSIAALAYHIFFLKKGLDSHAVQLLIALMAISTGGLGASLFSRSSRPGSNLPHGGEPGDRPRVPGKPRGE